MSYVKLTLNLHCSTHWNFTNLLSLLNEVVVDIFDIDIKFFKVADIDNNMTQNITSWTMLKRHLIS